MDELDNKNIVEIVASLDQYQIDDALYVEANKGIMNARFMVYNPDEAEDPEGSDYEQRKSLNLRYLIELSAIHQARDNALEQKPDISQEELVNAVLFYIEHDAFPSL